MSYVADRVHDTVVPTSWRTGVAAAILSVLIGFAIAIVSPIEGAAWAHLLVGFVLSFIALSQRDRVAESIGLGLYVLAILTMLFPFKVFVWPFFVGTEQMEGLTAVAGVFFIGPAAAAVAIAIAAAGYLIINYS